MVAKNALLFAALLASSMLFAGMGDWDGKLFINGTLAADGTQLCAYVNGVENSRTTIGAYASTYYLMTVIGDTGDNVTFNVFCDSQYPAKEGAQSWAASPPRHHLNLTIDYATTIGNASDITSNGTGTLNVTINGTAPGDYYSEVETVSVSSSNGVVLSFSFDFGNDSLNFSKINISVGNSSGASYISVSGVNDSGGQTGTKALTMYGVNTTYNGFCVEDVEGALYTDISAACTGTNEIQVPCNGTASGITCTQVGTTLTISGLHHSAGMQFSIPAATTTTTTTTTSSSSGGGGSGGSGASSGAASNPSTDYVVDTGTANCTVSVARELASSTNVSVLTTTITNNGGSSCTLTDFVFMDTIPSNFVGMNEINFTPAYTSREGWTAIFGFPSFASGESKTLAYSVAGWIPPSRVDNFTTVSLSAKKQVAAPVVPVQPKNETPVPGSDRDSYGCIPSAGYTWCAAKQKCLRTWEEACEVAKPAQTAKNETPSLPSQEQPSNWVWLAAAVVLVAIAIVAGAVYFIAVKGRKKGL